MDDKLCEICESHKVYSSLNSADFFLLGNDDIGLCTTCYRNVRNGSRYLNRKMLLAYWERNGFDWRETTYSLESYVVFIKGCPMRIKDFFKQNLHKEEEEEELDLMYSGSRRNRGTN